MKMVNGWAKLVNSVWLTVIPFLTQALFVMATRAMRGWGPGFGDIGFVTPVVSAMVGFVFVTRVMSRSQKVLVGLLYFPVMYVLLMFFSLGLVGYIYGDWL